MIIVKKQRKTIEWERLEIFGNGKTYLQENLRYWGVFHAKMCTIKDRNDMDLTEAEDIQKRWQDYT